jgi:predicted DNA-binding transcriptional regulator YafY
MLHTAIFNNRQIAFVYADWTLKKKLEARHDGALYRVSPLHLVWDDEYYYLIGFDENAKKVKHFRVDKMRNMEVLKLPRSEASLKQRVDLIGEVLWPE